MLTTSSVRSARSHALVLLSATSALLAGAVVLAGPAAAIEDPRRPAAEVTHGPSCGPAVIRVAVTNGTEAHRVALVFDGTTEQQAAELAAGEQAELTSADIDWGRTVDVVLTVTDTDGTAEDPIQFGTYTRPSAEDCAAVTPTTTPAPLAETTAQPSSAAPATSSTTQPSNTAPTVDPSSPSSEPASPAPPATSSPPSPPHTSSSTSPAPTSSDSPGPTSAPPSHSPPGDQSGTGTGGQAGASAASVSPGGVLTVRATGFTPGEPVTVSMVGVAHPLTTVTAGADGSVEAVVQIPRGAALGTATVQLVGGQSAATAGLDLQVAARARPVVESSTSGPVLSAGVALIGAAGVLGLAAARRSRVDRTTGPAEPGAGS